jgi:hypothetical protein
MSELGRLSGATTAFLFDMVSMFTSSGLEPFDIRVFETQSFLMVLTLIDVLPATRSLVCIVYIPLGV